MVLSFTVLKRINLLKLSEYSRFILSSVVDHPDMVKLFLKEVAAWIGN